MKYIMVSVVFALRVVPGLEPGSAARRARCFVTQNQLSAQFVFDVFFAKSFLFEANQPPAVMPTSKCGNCKSSADAQICSKHQRMGHQQKFAKGLHSIEY